MLGDPQTIPSAASARVVEYKGGDNGELVVVYNPATNSNRVFLALNRAAAVAAVSGQVVVAPGQFSLPFLLNMKENSGGINGIAETGDTVVTVFRAPFLSPELYNAAVVAFAAGVIAAQYWVAVSGTAVALTGAFTSARADAIQNKTAATDVSVSNRDTNTAGVAIGAGPNHGLANGSVVIGLGGNGIEVASSATDVRVSGTTYARFEASDLRIAAAKSIIQDNGVLGSADPRHTLSSTDRVMHTPVAGGLLSSTMDSIELPIANSVVLAVGDNAEIVGGNNRVQLGTALSTGAVGPVIVGGTGNAGGTVFARIRINGVLAQTLIADTAGVTAGLYLQFGAVNPAARVQDKATVEGTFGRTLTTAASGALTDAFLRGPS